MSHSTMPAQDPATEGFWMFLISFVSSPSSELFLALSGTVLLPVKRGYRSFYGRRFLKLVPPLVFWSVFGVFFYVYMRDKSWSWAWDTIVHIPVQPAFGPYWFVYAIAGLYLFAPIISPWIKTASKKHLEFFLMLWIINMFLPWFTHLCPNLIPGFNENGNYYWTLVYFGGFLGYWIMGYYLNNFPVKIGMNFRWIFMFALAISYPFGIIILKSKELDVTPFFDNLQIGSAALVAVLYTVMQNIRFNARIQKLLSSIAKYSFGIYLTHIFIRNIYWIAFEDSTIHTFPRTLIISLLIMATGYTLTWIFARIPKGKYIVGV